VKDVAQREPAKESTKEESKSASTSSVNELVESVDLDLAVETARKLREQDAAGVTDINIIACR
jgi:hypothetical protein